MKRFCAILLLLLMVLALTGCGNDNVTVIENGIVVEEAASSDNFLLAVICLLIGAFNIFFPYGAWYLSYGWKFRDAEPSDLVLMMTRIGGVIAVIIGFVFFII